MKSYWSDDYDNFVKSVAMITVSVIRRNVEIYREKLNEESGNENENGRRNEKCRNDVAK